MKRLHVLARRVRDRLTRDWPVITMYHRVARPAYDPWHIAVWPEYFAEQIEALVQLRRVVPLGWLAAELARGSLPKGVAAVTFDDGYADVLSSALPILQKYNCPATVFIVTGAVGSNRRFWWDELTRLILEAANPPATLEADVAGRQYRWRLREERSEPVTETAADSGVTRAQLYDHLWHLLRPLSPEVRDEFLHHLRHWSGRQIEATSRDWPLTANEIRFLAATGIVDIGAHTVTHPALHLLNEAEQRSEIAVSRTACEEITGRSAKTFAYPFGALNETAVAAVRNAGFVCACTTHPGRPSVRCDRMRLPRLKINNLTGEHLAHTLAL